MMNTKEYKQIEIAFIAKYAHHWIATEFQEDLKEVSIAYHQAKSKEEAEQPEVSFEDSMNVDCGYYRLDESSHEDYDELCLKGFSVQFCGYCRLNKAIRSTSKQIE